MARITILERDGSRQLPGARWIVQRLTRRDLEREIGHWIYVGDSTNDQEMFGHFPLSVGVANLRRFAAELLVWPTYITRSERGETESARSRA